MYFLRSLAGILLGMALMTLIFTTLLDYDPLRRYQAAMAAHRDNKEFGGGLVQIYQTFIINNLEYAILTGLPLVISVIYQTLASFTRYLHKVSREISGANRPVRCLYVPDLPGVKRLGTDEGEVGRIWLFLAPAVCLVGAYGMSRLYRSGGMAIYLMVGLQLMTAIMIFQFQDYGCRLCP